MTGAGGRAIAPYAALVGDPDAVADGLEAFVLLLQRWNGTHNLVSRETQDQLWSRHVADSLQLLPLLPRNAARILDLGSGGGFPALPLAVALKDHEVWFALVEASAKKAAFLRVVIRELGLNAAVENRRAEASDSRETLPDVVTSRALAPLPALLSLAAPLFGPQTKGLFHKGKEHGEELKQSRLAWGFDVVVHPSVTDSGGVILELGHLVRHGSPPKAEMSS